MACENCGSTGNRPNVIATALIYGDDADGETWVCVTCVPHGGQLRSVT